MLTGQQWAAYQHSGDSELRSVEVTEQQQMAFLLSAHPLSLTAAVPIE